MGLLALAKLLGQRGDKLLVALDDSLGDQVRPMSGVSLILSGAWRVACVLVARFAADVTSQRRATASNVSA